MAILLGRTNEETSFVRELWADLNWKSAGSHFGVDIDILADLACMEAQLQFLWQLDPSSHSYGRP